MASIDRLTSRRSMIATIGSVLALGVVGYGSSHSTDRADEQATEPTRTATSDERGDPAATDEPTDTDATRETTEATDDQAGCGCPD